VEVVRYSSSGSVATITIDNPPVNAFSVAVWTAFSAALGRAAADEGIHAVIVTGEGNRAFSAGADVKESATLTAEQNRDRLELVGAGLRRLAAMPVPVVCAINGPAVGGGLNLSALCDIRIAADGASFSLPEIDHGRVGGGGAFVRQLGVPAGVINQMLYTGRRLGAREALAAHLVDEVVPAAELMARAVAVAGAIAAKPRSALTTMKRAIRAASAQPDWHSGYRAAEGAS
jgi:enoyl-CoA hydratase